MTTYGPYPATVLSVHDGDTLHVDADLGWDIHEHADVRLYGCNAAELGTPSGDAAAAWLTALLPVGTQVSLLSHGYDKFGGRTDGAITLADGRDLMALAVASQYAAAWDGRGKAPVPPWPRTVTP